MLQLATYLILILSLDVVKLRESPKLEESSLVDKEEVARW